MIFLSNIEMQPGLISVVLPSRKRPVQLVKSWYTLRNTAFDLDGLDLSVAFDRDDPDTGEVVNALPGVRQNVEFPQRLFWDGNNTYFSRLIEQSTGEWILPWGDDGTMHTPGWDGIVRDSKPGVLYLRGGIGGHNVFPIVHRKVFEILPWQICPSPHQDTWLTDVARAAGVLYEVDITATEDRFIDETRPRERFRYHTEEYYSPVMAKMRELDASILMERRAELVGPTS